MDSYVKALFGLPVCGQSGQSRIHRFYRQRYEGRWKDRTAPDWTASVSGIRQPDQDFDNPQAGCADESVGIHTEVQGRCSMKTWVYRLTLNVLSRRLRKSYLRVSAVSLNELYDIVSCDPDQKGARLKLHDAVGCLDPLGQSHNDSLAGERKAMKGISGLQGCRETTWWSVFIEPRRN